MKLSYTGFVLILIILDVIKCYLKRQKFGKSYIENVISSFFFLRYSYFGKFFMCSKKRMTHQSYLNGISIGTKT